MRSGKWKKLIFVKVKSKIRLLIRSNPIIFRIYIVLTNGHPDRLPDKTTMLHVTGYQRSGNTFSKRIIERIFPDYNIATHIHCKASIKIAFKHNIPVIILIRSPRDSICSSILRRMEGNINDVATAIQYDLDEYFNYYSYVLWNLDRLKVIDFADLINSPINLIVLVEKLLNLEELNEDEARMNIQFVFDELNNSSRNDGYRNMPSVYKEEQKKKLLKCIQHNYMFNKCEFVYREIKRVITNENYN
jgi:hypothetical protein